MIKYLFAIFAFLSLSSCAYMQTDCATLVGDRDQYRSCMAAQGDAAAQYELGVAAFEVENYDRAIHWLTRAAQPRRAGDINFLEIEQKQRRELSYEEDEIPMLPGHRGAQRLLVRIYEEGIGVPVNPGMADRYRDMINPI